MERIEYSTETAMELEGLAWLGKVEVSFSPVVGWIVEMETYVNDWKVRAFFEGNRAYVGLQLRYDTATDALTAVLEGIANYVPEKTEEVVDKAGCPECGGKLHSFSRGRRGSIMHRQCKKCDACGYVEDPDLYVIEKGERDEAYRRARTRAGDTESKTHDEWDSGFGVGG